MNKSNNPLLKKTQHPDLSVDEIRESLSGLFSVIGTELLFFPVTGSTNTAAAGLAAKGQKDGTVIIADSQTDGKGRRGRTWVSPPGRNLYLSIILRPCMPPRDAAMLTLLSAVACASAIRKLSSVPVSIKWPNDLMAAGKKMGGILTEVKSDTGRVDYAVIGIGININLDSCDMPDHIRDTATSVMLQAGRPQSRTQYAVEIIKSVNYWYTIFIESGKGPIVDAWKRLSSTLGHVVTVTSGDAEVTGLAAGIDTDGALVLKLGDNSLVKISAGVVEYADRR